VARLMLEQAISIAQTALLDEHSKDLLPYHRQQIYIALDDLDIVGTFYYQSKLAVITAQYVIHKWYEAWEDDLPKEYLKRAEEVIGKSIDKSMSEKELFNAYAKINIYVEEIDHEASFLAGFSAYKALAISMGFNPWEEIEFGLDDDNDLDPETIDTALCAANAFSEPKWSEKFDLNKRLEFWKWWLLEAIPQTLL
jgi:Immunity protein Imm5